MLHTHLHIFYPALMGSKTPTSKFANARKLGGRSTACKSPIGAG
ncbi:spermidine/putrescine ABC transporter ATP-binding protein [Bacillus cereus]|uniref:Spermidine/putrescine ABC transporter ATP-binding protein n=1 Tax=Bacillus cereus TaxID=1396 RepID=A0A2C1D0E2_BACCE|nr:spermidine/putrescine ABC transporter ATP-binding protein [Bacillus cereus]